MTSSPSSLLRSPRLILRPWCDADAADLYRFASDPAVGPIAGWPPHTSVENSLHTIRGVLAKPETYALVLRTDMAASDGTTIPAGTAVGSVGIHFPGHGTCAEARPDEVEVGYWIAKPLWGRGLVPEAVRVILARAFGPLGCAGVWCGYYEGNEKSRRVQEKCGFRPRLVHTIAPHPLNGATAEYLCYLSREDYEALSVPVLHEMTLRPAPFAAVLSGRKVIELRLHDTKRQSIRIGDRIRFTCTEGGESVTKTVRDLHAFSDFAALYEALLPRVGPAGLGYAAGEAAHPADMFDYYPPEAVRQNGVLGIEIE